MSIEVIRICWLFLRMAFRSSAEGIFIYLLMNTTIDQLHVSLGAASVSRKKMIFFVSVYSMISTISVTFLNVVDVYRIGSAALVFLYFLNRHRKLHKKLIINYNYNKDIQYALTTAIILVLAVHSLNYISHMLLHTYCVSTGIYDTINSVRIFRELYKTAIMLLDIFFIFLVYKFRLIKMKDIKLMSVHKWVPISFGFCLVTMVYLSYTYYIFGNMPLIGQFRNTLLWTMALILPSYIGFYLTTAHLTRFLSLKENYSVDMRILIWIFNPSMIKTAHLDVYDSDIFISNFESKKLVLKQKLKKLGINEDYKGYSGLIFCLFLTRLFIGLKGWRFDVDIFGQASLVTDVPISKLHRDIENVIDQVWTTSEVQTLIDGYYLPYEHTSTYTYTHRPTVEEFLTTIAKSI